MKLLDVIGNRIATNVGDTVSTATTYAVGGVIVQNNLSLETWTNIVQMATAVLGMVAMVAISYYFKSRREKREQQMQQLTQQLLAQGKILVPVPVPEMPEQEEDVG